MVTVDIETERIANAVAAATGKPVSVVVRDAVTAEAARLGVMVPQSRSSAVALARMIAITDGFADIPVLDPRSADDIISYDRTGLPR